MKASSGASVNGIDFVVPGDIRTPTGGYIYDRRIAEPSPPGLAVQVSSLPALIDHTLGQR